MLNTPKDPSCAGITVVSLLLDLASLVLGLAIQALQSLKLFVDDVASKKRPRGNRESSTVHTNGLRGNQPRSSSSPNQGGSYQRAVREQRAVPEATDFLDSLLGRASPPHRNESITAAAPTTTATPNSNRNSIDVDDSQNSADQMEQNHQSRVLDHAPKQVVDWNQVKKSLHDGINSVDWRAIGESVEQQLANVDWDQVGEHLERVDWNQVGSVISSAFEPQNAKKDD